MKITHDRFRDLAAGVQSLVVAVAVVIGGAWTLYTFGAVREIDRRTSELQALRRSLTERGILDISITTTPNSGDATHRQYLVVNVQVSNKGNRTETLDWATGGLSAARTAVNAQGDQVHGPTILARYLLASGTAPETSTILPGQTRHFPFLLAVDNPGMYHLIFSVGVSPLELPEAMREHQLITSDTLAYSWTQTAYVRVE